MIRVVLDANVWISSVLNEHSIPGVLVRAARSDQFRSIVSYALIDQVQRHLKRLGFSDEKIGDAVVAMYEGSLIAEPRQTLTIIAGKDSDNRILECAVAGNANYIVTGDKKHLLPLGTFQGIRIVSPRDFLAFIDVLEP